MRSDQDRGPREVSSRIRASVISLLVAAMLVAGAAKPSTAVAAEACLTSLGPPADGVTNAVKGHLGANPPNSLSLFYAGTLDIQIDQVSQTVAYCVDLAHHIGIGDCVPQVAPAYPCEVVYILNHFYPNDPNYPIGGLATPGDEAAAVQSAIWHFTDDFTIDAPTSPVDIVSRTQSIIATAAVECGIAPAVPQTVTVAPAAGNVVLPQNTTSVTATVLDSSNAPVAGIAITLTVTGVSGPQTFNGTTDNAGQFTVIYTNASGNPGADVVTATVSYTIPVGVEFKTSVLQGIVLAGDPQTGSVSGSASETWSLPPTTTTSTSTSTSTTSSTSTSSTSSSSSSSSSTSSTSSTSTSSSSNSSTSTSNSTSTSLDPTTTLPTTTTTTPGGTTTTTIACGPTGLEQGNCSDGIDNDCNGLIDCDDPACMPATCVGGASDGQACDTVPLQMDCSNGGGDCHCPAILKDPTIIKFSTTGGLDQFTSHGRVMIFGPLLDVGASRVAWVVSNSRGKVFGVDLPPGAFTVNQKRTRFTYKNPAARTTGGVTKATIRITHGSESYGYRVEAYGDLSAATDADMSIQFYVADQTTPALHSETWQRTKFGWKAHGFLSPRTP